MIAMLLALAAADADAATQRDLDRRAVQASAAADAALNAQWHVTAAAMKQQDAADPAHGHAGRGYVASLLASQRAWLAFRDAECTAEGMRFAGGTAQPMAEAECRATVTRRRTAQLRDLAR